MNIQLLVDLHGRLLAASQAFPGSWHDVHGFREAGWVELLRTSGGGMGDVGYEGEPDVVHPPIKKRPNVDLREGDLHRAFARIGSASNGVSDTSRTSESYPTATAPTCPASTPTSTPPSACKSSTNSSPAGASPAIG